MNINLITYIIANPILFNSISIAFAIFGIFLAVVFYFRAQKLRLPTYAIRNFNLIKEKVVRINGLRVSYRRQNISNLSIARVALWNHGKETIRKEDVAFREPLRLVTRSNNEIFEAKIIYQKNEANNFFLVPRPLRQQVLINFDYFDKDEGVILQIFHTGKSSEDIEIQGVIKGVGNIKRMGDPFMFKIARPMSFMHKVRWKYKRLIVGVSLLIAPLLFIFLEFLPKHETKNFFLKYIPSLVVLVLYWSTAYAILHKRIPKGFELFEDRDIRVITS